MYICLWRTIEILSNMETKLCLVLHVDHKPLNIQTTQLNRLRNVNAIVLFIQLHRSLAFVYSPAFTFPRRRRVGTSQQSYTYIYIYMSMAAMSFSMFVYPPILFFSGSAADFYKIKACEQQTFTIIKEIIKPALTRDKIIVGVN